MALLLAAPAPAADCPAGPERMRRTHMDLLRHDRDLAVRHGLRRPGHDLADCVTCHARRDAHGQVVSAADPGHFCVTCHRRAAVAIDCFGCHRSTPAEGTP